MSTSTSRRKLDAYQEVELNSGVHVYVALKVAQLGEQLVVLLKGKRKLQAHIEEASCTL